MDLAKSLKKLMFEKDIKVTQLSRATKVPATTLHNWLSGQTPKDIKQVKRVADYFSVSLDQLFFPNLVHKTNPLKSVLEDEVFAGEFEVILRRINRSK